MQPSASLSQLLEQQQQQEEHSTTVVVSPQLPQGTVILPANSATPQTPIVTTVAQQTPVSTHQIQVQQFQLPQVGQPQPQLQAPGQPQPQLQAPGQPQQPTQLPQAGTQRLVQVQLKTTTPVSVAAAAAGAVGTAQTPVIIPQQITTHVSQHQQVTVPSNQVQTAPPTLLPIQSVSQPVQTQVQVHIFLKKL